MFHDVDTQQKLTATVNWIGRSWQVKIDDQILPDCCDTLEDAYTVAEREIERRYPGHKCQPNCRQWQALGDA